MTHKEPKSKRFYHSMIEFEKDFFPKSFSSKQAKRLADSRSIGVDLAKDSFRRIREDVAAGKLSSSE
jgi:hypothetical protein